MTRRLTKEQAGCLGMLLAMTSSFGWSATPPDAGQTLQQLQPPLPPTVPAKPAPSLQDETAGAAVTVAGDQTKIPVQRIVLTGNTVFPTATLLALLKDVPGTPRSLDDLHAAAKRVTDYYREHGYLLARAYLPPQEVSNGTVTLAILEGMVETVSVDNRSTVDSGRIQTVLARGLPAGRPVNANAANRVLILLQETPGISAVQGSLRPGTAVGSTDVAVAVAPQAKVTGSVGADNAGNRYTGQGRLLGDVSLNNPAGIGDRLALQGVVSEQDRLDYGHLSWDAPVGSDGLRLGAAFGNTRYELGGAFRSLDAHGTARTVALYGSYPLWLAPVGRAGIGLSLERRNLEDKESAVGGESKKTADAAVLTVDGSYGDNWLGSVANNAWRLAGTFGHLDLNTAAVAATDAVTARTAGDYGKAVLSATREQRLTGPLSLYVAGTLQRAGKNLDSSEQFVLGGPNGVRAYPTGEGIGDDGWLATVELRYRISDFLQLALFEDAGGVAVNHDPYIAQANGRHLSGGGLAATTTWQHFTVKASAAWRGDEVPTSDSDRQPRVWVSGNYSF